MLKRAFVAFMLLLFTAPVLAEPPTPLMWRATGSEGTVYLVGSFHLLRPSDYPLAKSLEQAYQGADRVIFEISPADMQSPDLARKFTAAGMLPEGQKLSEMVQPETREKLVKFLGSEAALPAVDPYKPWFFGLSIALTTMQAAGFDATRGLDQHFMARVAQDGKPTGGLETVDDQLAALDGGPWEEQEISLRESLKPPAELREDVERLHVAWRSGDAKALERVVIDEMMAKTPVTARLTNLERNERWVPQVQALLDQPGTTLVVVGALHLVGEDGLPALMEARGVRFERVGHR